VDADPRQRGVHRGRSPVGGPQDYNKLYDNLGFDEGRAVVAKQVDGLPANISVFVVDTSASAGNGRDFCVWKYRQ
jgi:hypothetical protein